MASIYDAKPEEMIEKLALELKNFKEIKAPVWAAFAKTGMFKERPPAREDWWYIRAAAILRSVAKLGPIGTSKLRKKYGGKKNNGASPEHFYRGSGNIIRKALQQLEDAGLVSKAEKGVHKGRIATPKAVSIMEKIAVKLMKESKSKVIKPKQEKEHKEESMDSPEAEKNNIQKTEKKKDNSEKPVKEKKTAKKEEEVSE